VADVRHIEALFPDVFARNGGIPDAGSGVEVVVG